MLTRDPIAVANLLVYLGRSAYDRNECRRMVVAWSSRCRIAVES